MAKLEEILIDDGAPRSAINRSGPVTIRVTVIPGLGYGVHEILKEDNPGVTHTIAGSAARDQAIGLSYQLEADRNEWYEG